MTDGHKKMKPYSKNHSNVGNKRYQSSKQSRLQTKIAGLIERHKCPDQPSEYSKSQSLIRSFVRQVWPEIRDDYRQMTHYLEEELSNVLRERHIDAEVLSRVKEDASIMKTLKRREEGLMVSGGNGFNSYQHIFREMHDLAGLRIVLTNRDHRDATQGLIEELFQKQKPPAHFDANREVGQFWRRPWFGAYETHNHRVQLADDNKAALRSGYEWSGVTFEVQVTTFSDNLYNKLAHTLLYKADPGLVTLQEEMVVDVSHGLARCFELCMRILRPKLHRDTDKRTDGSAGDIGEHTKEEVKLAQSVVDGFEKDLHDQPKSDRTAQLLRKLLSEKDDAEDQACLKDLLVSDPSVDKKRIEETRGGLLPSSYNWILRDHDFQRWQEDDQNHALWITGAPGKGKTMMLCGIIDGLSQESGNNVSYFFCQGTDKRINTGTAVLRGLLFLLCKQQHSLISHIRARYDDAGGKLFEDPNAWFALCGAFDNILGDSNLRDTYLIVDALDECLPDSRQFLANLIVRSSNAHSKVKWIVSSRELKEFNTYLQRATHLSLESRRESVSATVNAYVDFKTTKLRETHLSHSAMEQIKRQLKQKSEGTFLWVAIVCEQLEFAQEHNVLRILQHMPKGLGKLYGKFVDDINALDWADPKYCKSVLRAVAVAFRPLTLEELQQLADLPENIPAEGIAKMCMPLVTIRDDTVFFVHQSVKDYLMNEWSSVFQLSIKDTHESMFSRSVGAMKPILCQDIYNLGLPGISIEDVPRQSPDPLAPIQYSCAYWIAHFRKAQPCSAQDEVGGFLRVHLLHWLEALSLIRSDSRGLHALRDLVTLCNEGAGLGPLLHLASDMYRFARSYGAMIEKTPLQAYSSALIFSPSHSLTRTLFKSKEPDWIIQKPKVDLHWNSRLATLMGHVHRVCSVEFSHDGQHIVSGSSDGTIKIWDAESGSQTLSIQGHTDLVWSVAFDEKGKFIRSRSNDETVKTWDIETGACITKSQGSVQWIDTFIFSSDKRPGTISSLKESIRIADSGSSTEVLALQGHSRPGRSFVFTPDRRYIASGSYENTVKIWDAVKGDEITTLQGHTGELLSICVSSDGHRVACGADNGAIKIWDVGSSADTSTVWGHHSHRDQVTSVALTFDGRRIASTSRDGTVKIWDAETGDNIQTFDFRVEDEMWQVTFSPDGRYLAASNLNKTIVTSNTSGATISTYDASTFGPFALSRDGRYIASWRNTINIKDAENGKDVVALSGHDGAVTSAAFSPKDCHIVASASLDKTIKIWNVSIGTQISTVNVGTQIRMLKFDSTGAFLYADSLSPPHNSTWSPNSAPSQTESVLPRLKQYSYGLSEEGSWITRHGQNILWLPPEFRGTLTYPSRSFDVLPHMISIGCPSGRVCHLVIQWVEQKLKKPIKYVWPSHHHHDHASGVHDYINVGAKVIALDSAREYYTTIPENTYVTYTTEKPYVLSDGTMQAVFAHMKHSIHAQDYSYSMAYPSCATQNSTSVIFDADDCNPMTGLIQNDQTLLFAALGDYARDQVPINSIYVSGHGDRTDFKSFVDAGGYVYPRYTLQEHKHRIEDCPSRG